MISLNNVMGIIRRWKNSIISLRLGFLEIPHKHIWVSWGVLFKGLGVQKGTQAPCWLRPWPLYNYGHRPSISLSIRISSAPILAYISLTYTRTVHLFGQIIIDNNWNLYSAVSIHKMFKSAAHCHSLSHSQQRLNGRAWKGVWQIQS